jgi:hypothetical protein
VGEAEDSGTCICVLISELLVDTQKQFTHCANRPPCEMMIKILSAKYIDERSVGTPLTSPAACFVFAGKGEGVDPPPRSTLLKPCAIDGIDIIVGVLCL